jgi:MGT family glycosyltransferase
VKSFLFVVPPLTGHINPTISVGRELASRGHRVAWVGHARAVRPLLPEGAELIALEDQISDLVMRPMLEHATPVRGLESLRFLWEDILIPLARVMLPGTLRAIADRKPDVVVVDHQAIGGALAARLSGAKWATFATTSASVVDPLSVLPKVKEWVAAQVAELEAQAGLPPIAEADLSPDRVIVFSTPALVGRDKPFSDRYCFVGPSISDRPDATPFPWDALRDGPRVFVSLGTVSGESGEQFYKTAALALGSQPFQVILAAPPERVGAVPDNFIVQRRVPQLKVLEHVDAVVSHAGHNTVCESLAHGLPLVVAPIRDDQPIVADQVVRAGAGVRLKFGRLSPALLLEAVKRALHEPELKRAAARVAASFRAAGGAPLAANLLEEMA